MDMTMYAAASSAEIKIVAAWINYPRNLQVLLQNTIGGALMSLKGKLTALAGAKIAEKVIPKGSVDGVVNSVLNKLGQATGQKTAAEHIQGIKKNFLVIKSKS